MKIFNVSYKVFVGTNSGKVMVMSTKSLIKANKKKEKMLKALYSSWVETERSHINRFSEQEEIDLKMCEVCGKTFEKRGSVTCSDECSKKRKRLYSGNAQAYNGDTRENMRLSHKYNKNLNECSVECLLDEFGDIE